MRNAPKHCTFAPRTLQVRHTGRRRAGFALPEAMMAIAVALGFLAGLAHLLGMVTQQRRLARQQVVALQEAGNLLEEAASRRFAEVRTEEVTPGRLSEECRRCLPGAKVHMEVTDEDPDTKRVRVQIDWNAAAGQKVEPVRLIGWKYRQEEAGS